MKFGFINLYLEKKIGGRQWVGEVTVMGETWNAENVLIGGESLGSL